MTFNAIGGQSVVEKSANYQGNETLVMLARLRNPVIKKQIVELWIKAYNSDPSSTDRDFANAPNGFEQEIDRRLDQAEKVTPIWSPQGGPGLHPYGDRHGTKRGEYELRETVPPRWQLDEIGNQPTTKRAMSMTEAHEKGHYVRLLLLNYYDFFRDYFAKGFDLSHVVLTQDEYENRWAREGDPEYTLEKARAELIYYLRYGHEIAERMSQLKNYFGMKGDEIFTKEHLAYARKHYVKDVGFDNDMTHFFQAITPKTETTFLDLMKTSGI